MKRYLVMSLYLLTGVFPVSVAYASNSQPQPNQSGLVSDGPYLTVDKAAVLQAQWVCNGEVVEHRQSVTAPVLPRCGYDKPIQVATALPAGWQFQSARWAAISDIHGQYDLMIKLLQAAGIIGEHRQWLFGQHHLVIVGDVMDRGNKVTQALWFLYDLQQQAQRAGGAVHLLPGNHETMVLRGDLRYLHPDYLQVADKLQTRIPALYGENTILGAWLRQLPLFVRINDTLFVHGGISEEFAQQQADNNRLQQEFGQSWGQSKTELALKPLQQLLQGSKGPLWYRGYFSDSSTLARPALQQQLARFNASQIVVGHTSMDDVYSHHGGLVYSIDSSIKKGKRGAVLHHIDGRWFRSGLDGQLKPVQSAPKKTKNRD